MKIVLLILLGLLFTSCMHTAMVSDHATLQSNTELALQKEITTGNIKTIATFPPMEYGKETVFLLELSDTKTSQPISGAKVFGHIQYVHKEDRFKHDHDSSRVEKAEIEHDLNWNQQVEETREPGVYSFSYKCYQTGEHRIIFHVTGIGEQLLDKDIVIEAIRMIFPETRSHEGGMHGIGSDSTYLIIGTLAMSVMMMGMLLVRGGMF